MVICSVASVCVSVCVSFKSLDLGSSLLAYSEDLGKQFLIHGHWVKLSVTVRLCTLFTDSLHAFHWNECCCWLLSSSLELNAYTVDHHLEIRRPSTWHSALRNTGMMTTMTMMTMMMMMMMMYIQMHTCTSVISSTPLSINLTLCYFLVNVRTRCCNTLYLDADSTSSPLRFVGCWFYFLYNYYLLNALV